APLAIPAAARPSTFPAVVHCDLTARSLGECPPASSRVRPAPTPDHRRWQDQCANGTALHRSTSPRRSCATVDRVDHGDRDRWFAWPNWTALHSRRLAEEK